MGFFTWFTHQNMGEMEVMRRSQNHAAQIGTKIPWMSISADFLPGLPSAARRQRAELVPWVQLGQSFFKRLVQELRGIIPYHSCCPRFFSTRVKKIRPIKNCPSIWHPSTGNGLIMVDSTCLTTDQQSVFIHVN